ncbi:MAG: hypothetical protein M0Z55_09995 [Peptococcaceae bacterium]|nr:hypothetical protein [Peptococcaceae bacterium]
MVEKLGFVIINTRRERDGGKMLNDVRCQCGKLLGQHDAEVFIIKCRHCKRIVNITINKGKTVHVTGSLQGKYIITEAKLVNI